jgi:hypothetical protein
MIRTGFGVLGVLGVEAYNASLRGSTTAKGERTRRKSDGEIRRTRGRKSSLATERVGEEEAAAPNMERVRAIQPDGDTAGGTVEPSVFALCVRRKR